jgi:hypothetical protein
VRHDDLCPQSSEVVSIGVLREEEGTARVTAKTRPLLKYTPNRG